MNRTLTVLFLYFCSWSPMQAQQVPTTGRQVAPVVSAERDRGVGLARKGDYKGAIESFQMAVKLNAADADAWCYLGMALTHENKLGDAAKAFRSAIKLNEDFGIAHSGLAYALLLSGKTTEAFREADAAIELNINDKQAYFVRGLGYLYGGEAKAAITEAETIIKIDSKFAEAYLLKSRALVSDYTHTFSTPYPETVETPDEREKRVELHKKRLGEAAESLQTYVDLKPKSMDADEMRKQLETLRFYGKEYEATQSERTVFSGKEVSVKAVIKRKPEPSFDMRGVGSHGTVVLRAVLSSDGVVKYILPLATLPNGLTESAIEAARKIRFVPAQKDGKPVSQWIQIEYNFM